jgi:hypothetical protein
MGSRSPAPFRGAVTFAGALGTGLRKMAGAGTGTARFWRDLSLLALILVLSVLFGLRAVGRLMRGRWAFGFAGLAIVIPLSVFAVQPYRAWRATADNPQPGQTASAAIDAALIREWRRAVEEAPKEDRIGQQRAADGETGAGAVAARTEEKLPPQETWRIGAPRQDARPPQKPAQEARATQQPMQETTNQRDADATKETNPIAGAPAGPAVDAPASEDGIGSTPNLRSFRPDAAPFRGRETGWRRSLRGHHRHYQVGWSYRVHTTGVARAGPALLYLAR